MALISKTPAGNRIFFYLILFLITLFLISAYIVPLGVIKSAHLQGPRIWFGVVTSATFILSGFTLFRAKRPLQRLRLNKVDLLMGLTPCYFLLQHQFTEHGVEGDKLLVFVCLTVLYFLLRVHISVLTSEELKRLTKILSAIFIFLAGLNCCYGLIQILQNTDAAIKVTGPFYTPPRFALYLISILPFCICYFLFVPTEGARRKYYRHVVIAVCCLSLIVLAYTSTRAAWIAMGTVICYTLGVKYNASVNRLKRKIFFVGGAMICLLALSFFLFKFKPDSVKGRLTIWKVSSSMAEKNIIFGVGYGNFDREYNNYQAQYFKTNKVGEAEILRADTVRYAYNEFLHVLCEQGIIGLMMFILLLYFVLRNYLTVCKTSDPFKVLLARSCFTGLLAIFISGLFSYPFDVLPVFIIIFLYIGILSGLNTSLIHRNKYTISKLERPIVQLSGAVLIISATLLLFRTHSKYRSYNAYLSATNSSAMAGLYPQLQSDLDFMDDYVDLLISENRHKEVIALLQHRTDLIYPSLNLNLGLAYEAQQEFKKAEVSLQKAVNMVPNRFYSRYVLATFYYQTGQYEKAKLTSLHLLALKPKVPSLLVDQIRNEIRRLLIEHESQ